MGNLPPRFLNWRGRGWIGASKIGKKAHVRTKYYSIYDPKITALDEK